MGTVTFHSWPTADDGTDAPNNHPDQLRIDLDPPPETDFRRCAGSRPDVVKPVLDELGLPGFVKTSGSRGIHVFIPIRPQWDFIATRRAVIALGRDGTAGPDRITMSWWKEGAWRPRVHRLQPERPRPQHGQRLLRAAQPDRASRRR